MNSAPRVVLVTRPTPLEQLVASHGTLGQARFFLKTRGRPIDPLLEMRERQLEAMRHVKAAIPRAWRSVRIDRPLDFMAVTDHAEFLGERELCRDPESAIYDVELCREIRAATAPIESPEMTASTASRLTVPIADTTWTPSTIRKRIPRPFSVTWNTT